jgi:hypothetical protein
MPDIEREVYAVFNSRSQTGSPDPAITDMHMAEKKPWGKWNGERGTCLVDDTLSLAAAKNHRLD